MSRPFLVPTCPIPLCRSASHSPLTTRQRCKFDKEGQPILSQTLRFATQDPLVDQAQPELLYGYYPDGTQGCIGDVADAPDSPYEDRDPPRVTDCPAADFEDLYQFTWWFSRFESGPGQFRKSKPSRYGQRGFFARSGE